MSLRTLASLNVLAAFGVMIPIAAMGNVSCTAMRPITSSTSDFEDYRAYRSAAHRAMRLAKAEAYLAAHPKGAWRDEVASVFERDEEQYFEAAKNSRAIAEEYVTVLPRGPHASAAAALLVAFEAKAEDIDAQRLSEQESRTEAHYEREVARRKTALDLVTTMIAAVVDENIYGAKMTDLPQALARILAGGSSVTWGTSPSERRFSRRYVVPTPDGEVDRTMELTFRVLLTGNRVIETRIEGTDLFARLTEVGTIRAVDDETAKGRRAARAYVREHVESAVLRVTPDANCEKPLQSGQIFVRQCAGWSIEVNSAASADDLDRIIVRGPNNPR